jgi:hypothetical protein
MAKTKKKISKALRDQVWLRGMGKKYEGKCMTSWCQNTISVVNFQCGHNIPESKGGSTTIDNLVPICNSCNASMSNHYTFDQWSQGARTAPPPSGWFCC